ncbi:PAS domain S-box protein, partial [Rhodopseudomonas palustris]|nr:PAS domain S-box protein [Rhodopseudomonas palustris]
FTLRLGRDEGAAYFKCHSTVISVLEDVASVVSIEDVTDERKAEEARNLLATVIEQTGDTIIIAGTDEVIQYINPAGLKNSGFNETELIGTTQHVFTDGLMDPAMIGELRKTIAGGRSWHGRFKSRRKDDSIIDEDVTVSPVRNEEGDLTHYVSIKRDITEMTLLQGQLLQVQKLEAIGRLAAGIAHEINTPMQ